MERALPKFDDNDPVVRQAYLEVLSNLPELAAIPPRLKALAIPRSLRGDQDKLAKMPLPRIIGVLHIEDYLSASLRLIERLPPNSKVALEGNPRMNYCPGYPAPSPKRLGHNFFDRLAARTTELGHTVVWLERGVTALGASWQHSAVPTTNNLGPKLTPRFNYEEIRAITTLWRSCVQSRTVLSSNWKSTDLVLVGAIHAIHLASFWKRPLHGAAHRRSKSFIEMIASIKGQLSLYNDAAKAVEKQRKQNNKNI